MNTIFVRDSPTRPLDSFQLDVVKTGACAIVTVDGVGVLSTMGSFDGQRPKCRKSLIETPPKMDSANSHSHRAAVEGRCPNRSSDE
jgi:hypothetical protein